MMIQPVTGSGDSKAQKTPEQILKKQAVNSFKQSLISRENVAKGDQKAGEAWGKQIAKTSDTIDQLYKKDPAMAEQALVEIIQLGGDIGKEYVENMTEMYDMSFANILAAAKKGTEEKTSVAE